MVNFIAVPADGRVHTFDYSSAIGLAGRVLLAAIFVLSGIGKVADPSATIAYIGAVGLPLPQLAFVGATALEIGGGISLVVGYRTRLVAAALALFSLLTAITFHSALADQNQMIQFMKNLAMAGGLLQIVAFGAGAFSFDNRRKSDR